MGLILITFCEVILLSAFEFGGTSGIATATIAGGAVDDWQHAFTLNPALARADGRFHAGAAGTRPYGLDGLSWLRADGNVRLGVLNTGLAGARLGSGSYQEFDFQGVVAASPVASVATGIGLHGLVRSTGDGRADLVPAIDAGIVWETGRLRLGAAGLGVNAPRWRNGDQQRPRLIAAAAWQPVDELQLAADAIRDGENEKLTCGVAFRLLKQLVLGFGVGTAPLRYAGGLKVRVGGLGFGYAYQYHPQLEETHMLGLEANWF